MACKFLPRKGQEKRGSPFGNHRFRHQVWKLDFENPFSLRFLYFPYLLWQIKVAILRISFRVCLLAAYLWRFRLQLTWPPSCLNPNPLEIFIKNLLQFCGLLSRTVNMLPNVICCANLWFFKRFIVMPLTKQLWPSFLFIFWTSRGSF